MFNGDPLEGSAQGCLGAILVFVFVLAGLTIADHYGVFRVFEDPMVYHYELNLKQNR